MRQLRLLSLLCLCPTTLFAQDAPSEWRCIENRGQWDERVHFAANVPAGAAWLTSAGITLALDLPEPAPAPEPGSPGLGAGAEIVRRSRVLELLFEGGSAGAPIPDADPLPGIHNFYLGERQTTRVRAFPAARYPQLWSGIDLVVRSGEQLLSYDLHLAPGAALDAALFTCPDIDALELLANGELALHTADGTLRQTAPIAWQIDARGERREVPCRFELRGAKRYGFSAPERDPALPLVIDPGLLWSTFVGGSLVDQINAGTSTASPGTITIAGHTRSLNYPVGPFAIAVSEACVTRLDLGPGGATSWGWSTVYGGNNLDAALDIAQELVGGVPICAITGVTLSPNLLVTGGFRTTYAGGMEGFAATFDHASGALIASTYVGGNLRDWGCRVVVHPTLGITVAGYTESTDLSTTTGALQQSFGGVRDAFVWRLTSDLSALAYGTYSGGSADEGYVWANWQGFPVNLRNLGLDQDPVTGVISITGLTWSSNYPLRNPYYTLNSGGWDCFVSVLDPNLVGSAQLIYSTYLGATSADAGQAVHRSGSGRLTVGGYTYSSNFPVTPRAFQTTFGGTIGANNDAFLSVLDPSFGVGFAQLAYSTYLGGSEWEAVMDLCVDRSGAANLVGFNGPLFPTTPWSYQPNFAGAQDAFLLRLEPRGNGTTDLCYGTQLGGGSYEFAGSVEFASGQRDTGAGELHCAGSSQSASFPMLGLPFQSMHAGATDGWAAALDPLPQVARRYGGSAAHCGGEILADICGDPTPTCPPSSFELRWANAPASSPGLLVVGAPLGGCLPLSGALLCVTPSLCIPLLSDGAGTARLAASLPCGASGTIHCQALWYAGLTCPPPQVFASASHLSF